MPTWSPDRSTWTDPISAASLQLPPLLNGQQTAGGACPHETAIAGVDAGTLGAGDFLWSLDGPQMRLAVVLEPEVARGRCHEMLFVLMVAFGDAFGALSPPEIDVAYDWPDTVLVNGARVGKSALTISPGEEDGVPDWMVVGLAIAMAPGENDPEAGFAKHITTLRDEGCGDMSALELLEATARHFLVWVHGWEEDGFAPVHVAWQRRMAKRKTLSRDYQGQQVTGHPMGLDEHGGLLLRCADGVRGLQIPQYLGIAR